MLVVGALTSRCPTSARKIELSLLQTLTQLPDDLEITVKSRYGNVTSDTVANFIEDHNDKFINLDDFELVSEVYLPGQNGYPIPGHLRAYVRGDIGGFIDPPGDVTLRGPLGEWLAAIEPETEASVASLGAGIIAALGAFMGRGIRLRVGRITHTPNIFAVQVGPTGTARKGTADGEIREFLYQIDPVFVIDNIASGFGSGEALIERVADPVYNSKDELVAGSEDQRLYIQESEFSKSLRIADRQGSILSDVIRLAFDGNRPLANAAKTTRKLKSSNHCISLFGGITPDELVKIFPALAAVSGTGNRYLWVWSDPDKLLPYGGIDVDVSSFADKVRANISMCRQKKDLTFSESGSEWWEAHYPALRQVSEVPESIRPLVTRISDQTQRIALVYAATEGSLVVTAEHLDAGYAWVRHSIQTVQAVLGGLVRNEEAGRILGALRQHPGIPASRKEIHDLFSRHSTSTAIDSAISELEKAGLAYSWRGVADGGRPPQMVMATTPKKGGSEKTYFARNGQNRQKEGSETSFAATHQNREISLEEQEKSKSEKRGYKQLWGKSVYPRANEVSPEDLPDPW